MRTELLTRSWFSYYLYNNSFVHFVLPTKHHRGRVDLFEILVNSVDQFLLADYADSSEHGTRHLAELILDQIQPRAVFRREHENESLGHGLQVAARLFGDVRGMVVQHQSNLMVLRIGAVQLLQESDEIATGVRVADGFGHSPTVQVQAGQ